MAANGGSFALQIDERDQTADERDRALRGEIMARGGKAARGLDLVDGTRVERGQRGADLARRKANRRASARAHRKMATSSQRGQR